MIRTPQPVRGTQSLLGIEADRFARVITTFNAVRRRFRFSRVFVPLIEHTEVFARSIGETTDVVSKEMYTFLDKGDESITLRPELTAGISRAYVSERWQHNIPLKVGSWGPAFRYERPQKGRFRQFHQVDAEIIGAPESSADIELLAFAAQFLDELKVTDLVDLRINTLGDTESRLAWRIALSTYFRRHLSSLSAESIKRLDANPLRILDSKDSGDRELIRDAPVIDDFLSSESGKFFDEVVRGLDNLGVRYSRDKALVRGLDYYRHTAFEFVTGALGAQGTVLGGGRYDGLIETLGGASTPAVGWAAGVERLALLAPPKIRKTRIFAIVPENDASEGLSQKIANRLRRGGAAVDYLYRGSAKKRLEKLQRRGATTALFINAIDDDSEVIGSINIKQYRRFSSTEASVANNLRDLFDVLSFYDLQEEGNFRGSRADIILRRPKA